MLFNQHPRWLSDSSDSRFFGPAKQGEVGLTVQATAKQIASAGSARRLGGEPFLFCVKR